MLDELSEPPGEGLLGGVVEVLLVAKSENLVFQQSRANGGEGFGRDVAGQFHPSDLGANGAGDRMNAQTLVDAVLRGGGGHGGFLCGADKDQPAAVRSEGTAAPTQAAV